MGAIKQLILSVIHLEHKMEQHLAELYPSHVLNIENKSNIEESLLAIAHITYSQIHATYTQAYRSNNRTKIGHGFSFIKCCLQSPVYKTPIS